MRKVQIISALALTVGALLLASCGNTIRGMGDDTADMIDATKNAGQSIDQAVK